MKFSHKLTLAVSSLVLISLSTLAFLQYKASEGNMRNQIYTDTHDITAKIATNIDTQMMKYKSVFNFLLKSLHDDFSEKNVRAVLNNPALADDFALVALGYAKDGAVVSDNIEWEGRAKAKKYDPRVRPWYKDAKRERKIGFTKPYLGSISKKLLTSLYAPVIDKNNNFHGAFFADISLTFLSDLIDSLKIANNAGQVFLVNKDGIIVAHPDKKLIMKPLADFVPELKIKPGAVQQFTVDGRDILFGFAPLQKMPWYIVGMVDEENAFQKITEMGTRTITFVVIALIICTTLVLTLIPILFRPLTALNTAIQNVASGDADLTQRLNTNTDKEFSILADGFNRFIGMLQHQIDETKQSSKRIRELSEETIRTGEHARGSVGTQQQELDQLATAMNEMSSTAQEVAANAQEASTATEDARQATLKGSEIVNKSSNISQNIAKKIEHAGGLVHELEQSTTDIESILEVITQISEQTNLLALNAAIEAARAGDSGRGFAVVADEVRTLAQRTQDSTTEIRTKIEHLQGASQSVVNIMDESIKEVEISVNVAEEANGELISVSEAINSATDLVTQIASAAEEQHSVAEEININTNNIKDLATEVLQSIETTTQQSNEQDQLVNFQEELLGHFKV